MRSGAPSITCASCKASMLIQWRHLRPKLRRLPDAPPSGPRTPAESRVQSRTGGVRVANRTFEPGVDPSAQPLDDAICFAFRKGHLLIGPSAIGSYLPTYGELTEVRHLVLRANFIGHYDRRPAFA